MTIVDLPSDRGFVHFARITKSLPELPEFVKDASTDKCAETSELPSSCFADVINRKFPVHTKASAFLSYLYFHDQKSKFSKEAAARISSKFESAAETWGIRTELMLANELYGTKPVEKQAGAEAHALNVHGQLFFPIVAPSDILKSAEQLINNRGNFTYGMRKEAATNIMKAAVGHGFATKELPEELHHMAGFGLCEKTAAVNEINRRVAYAAGMRSPISKTMFKLSSDLENAKKLAPEDMVKIAEIVDTVDRELNITSMYGAEFKFPEDVFFGAFTEKTAEHIKKSTVCMITGSVYGLDQLSKAADALKVFGDDFYNDVVGMDGTVDLQKVADILPTMPRDDAALFDRAMQSATGTPGLLYQGYQALTGTGQQPQPQQDLTQGGTTGMNTEQLHARMRQLQGQKANVGVTPGQVASDVGQSVLSGARTAGTVLPFGQLVNQATSPQGYGKQMVNAGRAVGNVLNPVVNAGRAVGNAINAIPGVGMASGGLAAMGVNRVVGNKNQNAAPAAPVAKPK